MDGQAGKLRQNGNGVSSCAAPRGVRGIVGQLGGARAGQPVPPTFNIEATLVEMHHRLGQQRGLDGDHHRFCLCGGLVDTLF